MTSQNPVQVSPLPEHCDSFVNDSSEGPGPRNLPKSNSESSKSKKSTNVTKWFHVFPALFAGSCRRIRMLFQGPGSKSDANTDSDSGSKKPNQNHILCLTSRVPLPLRLSGELGHTLYCFKRLSQYILPMATLGAAVCMLFWR